MKSKYAGQIYKIENEQIHIRLGRPYLISEGTVLRAGLGSLVEKSDLLATLVYDKLKTVDIVQGLPKVEEILEARKKNLLTKRVPTNQKKGLLIQKTSLDLNFEFRKMKLGSD